MKKPALMLLVWFAYQSVNAAPGIEPLVDVGWIKANACKEGIVVLDIRNALDGGSKALYLDGHIPCAVYTDYLNAGWRSEVAKVPGQLSPVDKLEKLIGSLGIDNDTHVVIYHHGKSALDLGSATRIYWTFKVLGHDEVSILDGGFFAYAADPKNRLESGANMPQPKTFRANLREDMLITKDNVAAQVGTDVSLVDLRPSHYYIGLNRHPMAARNGTIPGAVNLPESWLTVNAGGRFRSQDEIAQLFRLANIPADRAQVHFCNTGHWASLGWFTSSEILGNKDAKLYDGSMVEWAGDESLPIETKMSLK